MPQDGQCGTRRSVWTSTSRLYAGALCFSIEELPTVLLLAYRLNTTEANGDLRTVVKRPSMSESEERFPTGHRDKLAAAFGCLCPQLTTCLGYAYSDAS